MRLLPISLVASLAPARSFALGLGVRPGTLAAAARRGLVRAAADSESETSKGLYAIGYNIGRQLTDLKVLTPPEVDSVLRGMRDTLLDAEPEVPLSVYVPKAAEYLQSKQAAAAEKNVGAGVAALSAAAAEPGATQTASGLVYLELVGGAGKSPAATDTVRVETTPTCEASAMKAEPAWSGCARCACTTRANWSTAPSLTRRSREASRSSSRSLA